MNELRGGLKLLLDFLNSCSSCTSCPFGQKFRDGHYYQEDFTSSPYLLLAEPTACSFPPVLVFIRHFTEAFQLTEMAGNDYPTDFISHSYALVSRLRERPVGSCR